MAKKLKTIEAFRTRNKALKDAVALGKRILKEDIAIIQYGKKPWSVGKLLQHLARTVMILEKNQCKVSARCLFEAQHYMDQKYLERKPDGKLPELYS